MREVLKELKGGLSFEVVVVERFIDRYILLYGGDLGFVIEVLDNILLVYIEEV